MTSPLVVSCVRRLWPDRHSPYPRVILRTIIRDARLHKRMFGRPVAPEKETRA